MKNKSITKKDIEHIRVNRKPAQTIIPTETDRITEIIKEGKKLLASIKNNFN